MIEQNYWQVLVQGWGSVDEEVGIAEICQRYGWTYYDYMNQPEWFLDIIRLKMRLEAENEQRLANKK